VDIKRMEGPITARLVMNPNSVEDKIQRPSVNAFVLEPRRAFKGAKRARERNECDFVFRILREEFLRRDLGEVFFFFFLVFISDGITETEFFGGIFGGGI
jgi:hypothetical protein